MSIFKAKANELAEKMENPNEMLDYSLEKQTDLINKLRRDIAQVVTSKKRLEMQKAKLETNMTTLEQQARRSLESGREDLARLALERKNLLSTQIQSLTKQINDIEREQVKLEDAERNLTTKIEEFKTRKEIIKAEYSSAEAQVKIKESFTGISKEMDDIGMVLNRVEEKTENMKAKSQALDEMIDSGILTDYASSLPTEKMNLDVELDKMTLKKSVDDELAKLKQELNKT